MPTVSVKLPEDAKARVDRLAASQGVTPHAFMVEAIQHAAQQAELRQSFVQDALAAQAEMLRTGEVYDGQEVAAYLRAKLAGKPIGRPRPRQLASYARRQAE